MSILCGHERRDAPQPGSPAVPRFRLPHLPTRPSGRNTPSAVAVSPPCEKPLAAVRRPNSARGLMFACLSHLLAHRPDRLPPDHLPPGHAFRLLRGPTNVRRNGVSGDGRSGAPGWGRDPSRVPAALPPSGRGRRPLRPVAAHGRTCVRRQALSGGSPCAARLPEKTRCTGQPPPQPSPCPSDLVFHAPSSYHTPPSYSPHSGPRTTPGRHCGGSVRKNLPTSDEGGFLQRAEGDGMGGRHDGHLVYGLEG